MNHSICQEDDGTPGQLCCSQCLFGWVVTLKGGTWVAGSQHPMVPAQNHHKSEDSEVVWSQKIVQHFLPLKPEKELLLRPAIAPWLEERLVSAWKSTWTAFLPLERSRKQDQVHRFGMVCQQARRYQKIPTGLFLVLLHCWPISMNENLSSFAAACRLQSVWRLREVDFHRNVLPGFA